MTVHSIGPNSVAVFLEQDDLAKFGYDPAELTEDAARCVACAVLSDMGVEPGQLIIEAFSGKNGAIVFAEAKREACLPGNETFVFTTLRQAADAARHTVGAGTVNARLHFCDGRYYITMRGQRRVLARQATRVCEFGKQIKTSPWLEAHLAEHGDLLADGDALEKLRLV